MLSNMSIIPSNSRLYHTQTTVNLAKEGDFGGFWKHRCPIFKFPRFPEGSRLEGYFKGISWSIEGEWTVDWQLGGNLVDT